MNIGESLKYFRLLNGLSQTDLAKKTGINQQNISRWENGTHIPNVKDCWIIADYYEISIDELVGKNKY